VSVRTPSSVTANCSLPDRNAHRRLVPGAAGRDLPDEIPRPISLPGVHEAAQRLAALLPRGHLVELGAGEGAFCQWALQENFKVTALEIDPAIFRVPGAQCLAADLNTTVPLPDACCDLAVAMDIVEHLENPFQLLREMERILRPGGRAIISTPNEHNLANRWTYFTTGFYGDSRRVIDENDPQLPMKHINMTPPAQLELVWRRAGFELERVEVSRHRALAWLLLPVLWPLQTFKYWSKIRSAADDAQRQRCRDAYAFLNRLSLQVGRVIVCQLRKPGPGRFTVSE